MTSEYARTIGKLNAAEGDRQPCKRCSTPTAIATLSHYGGRCFGCYEDFSDAAFAPMPAAYDTPQQAEMRARLKANRPKGNATPNAAAIPGKPEPTYGDQQRRIREYAKKFGLSLPDASTLLGDQSRAIDGSGTRARFAGERP